MQHRRLWAFVSVILFAAACGGGSVPEEAPPAAPAATPIDPASAGNVSGAITLEGTPPAPEAIRMNSDPVCLTEASDTQTEYYVVGDGGGSGTYSST